MKVWIDLANTPQVRVFEPVVQRLRERGDEVLVTARNHRETATLARTVWPDVEIDGGSSPDGRAAKGLAIGARVARLARRGRRFAADVALSHNSYAQLTAARLLGVPSVTAMDYEHQPANHLAFRLATRVLVPDAFPAEALRRYGAAADRVRRYRGLKEQMYVDRPRAAGARAAVGVPPAADLAVLRLPPDGALYHRDGNDLVDEVVERLQQRTVVVVLARSNEQRAAWRARAGERLVVVEPPIDAHALLDTCAVFVGAGGTMTREAAVLGVPTVSIFAGRSAAVDRWLEEEGRLTFVRERDELDRLDEPRPRLEPLRPDAAGGLLDQILAATLEVVS